jgi:dipeptide/tripeptide permease
MAPKNPSAEQARDLDSPTPARADRSGAVWFGAGVALMAIGYVLLALAGRQAAGAAGRLAPFCIVGGLIVFGLGFLPRKE